MINPFKLGDTKAYSKVVKESEIAEFDSGVVHHFYGTFALARDAEWAGRLFVLEMKEEDEEGIGTFVHVEHKAPALVGEKVDFTAYLHEVSGNNVICDFEAWVGNRLVAKGSTGQKIVKKEKLDKLEQSLHG